VTSCALTHRTGSVLGKRADELEQLSALADDLDTWKGLCERDAFRRRKECVDVSLGLGCAEIVCPKPILDPFEEIGDGYVDVGADG
jgi:hypothetical protein